MKKGSIFLGFSGISLYGIIRRNDRYVLSNVTQTFVPYNELNWSQYFVMTLIEEGTTGHYVGDLPTYLPNGEYIAEYKLMPVGTKLPSDFTYGFQGVSNIDQIDTINAIKQSTDTIKGAAYVDYNDFQPNSFTIRRGDSINKTIPKFGSISGASKIWFTVKRSKKDADSRAIIQILLNQPSSSDGLLYLNGIIQNNSPLGSLTISGDSVNLVLDETKSVLLAPAEDLYYDVQIKLGNDIITVADGTMIIYDHVTMAIA